MAVSANGGTTVESSDRSSSSHSFVQAIRPEVAIMSQGSHGSYHHPREAVLDTLRMVEGIEIYQTNRLQDDDLDGVGGNVGDDFIADLNAHGDEGTITLTVRRDSFVVELLDREIRRTYPIQR